jgi:hypothetical protein
MSVSTSISLAVLHMALVGAVRYILPFTNHKNFAGWKWTLCCRSYLLQYREAIYTMKFSLAIIHVGMKPVLDGRARESLRNIAIPFV